MIPQDTVELILNTAKIEEVVGDYVTLKRRGASYVACCPFHNEKTPSFYVTPSKGIYKCFGCGKAGTAVGFVMEQEHCDYPEALRYLARKYHIAIQEEEETPEVTAARQRKESLLLATEFANKFFVDQLSTPEGRATGYAYYKSRGLEDSTIQKFSLGWAPSGGTTLMNAAMAAGYKQEYLLEAGLIAQKEDGALVDKFRERVMFPIYSVSGRVIAFSGRTLKADNPAKYVNSPDTPLYTKSDILYGLFQAKSEIGRQNRCIVVEGNLDMVMMHQLGITNVVAPCGTSFTTQQMHLIHKFTENLTVMFDGDSAGIHAALKVMDDVLLEGLNMKVVLLPEGEDPDSFARKHTLLQVQAYIEEHEKDCIDFKTDWLLQEAGDDPLRRADVIGAVSDTIAAIPDAIKRSTYAERFAARMGVDKEEIVHRRVKTTRNRAIEENKRREERESRVPGQTPDAPVTVEITKPKAPLYPIENKILAPIEAEILGFLLMDGDKDVLYEDEQIPLPEFVSEIITQYGKPLSNSVYRKLYDEYMALYESIMPETDPEDPKRDELRAQALEEILRRLLNSPDPQVNAAAQDLGFEKYKITYGKLSGSMRATGDWLKHAVPKSLFTLVEKRIQSDLGEKRREEAATEDFTRQMEILEEINKLSRERERIRKLIKEKTV